MMGQVLSRKAYRVGRRSEEAEREVGPMLELPPWILITKGEGEGP